MSSVRHTCQKSRHVLTTHIQRQLEWGLTVVIHGMYIRAILKAAYVSILCCVVLIVIDETESYRVEFY
jgi:hypothetical protein